MAGPVLLLGLGLLVAGLVWAWLTTQRPAWAPHGPLLLPWLGNALAFDQKHPHRTYSRWSQKYGSIYHVKLGPMHQVVLSDPDLIREAFGRSEVSGRPDTSMTQFIVKKQGLGFSQGQLWQESRRLTLHHLRNFGMGKSRIECYIHQQINGFIEQVLTPNCGRAIAIDHTLNVAVVNILWKLMASEELQITDFKIQEFIRKMLEAIQYSTSLIALDAVPWLTAVLPDFVFKKAKKEREFCEMVHEGFKQTLQQHREDLNLIGEPRDYLEALLQEQHRHPERMPEWHLLMCLRDLFIAGSDTTTTTLRWALCFLSSWPECQRRLQAELDAQVGRQRVPTLADRRRLPYTEALILETQRLGNIVPTLLPHQTLAPVTVGGYRLPAGVQVVADAHTVHCGAGVFSDPLQFRPERFLDADGQFQPDKNVMAFSVGKRQCLGESLARAELFLFLTAFLQKFSFCWPEGEQHDMSEDNSAIFMRMPAPYKIIPNQR